MAADWEKYLQRWFDAGLVDVAAAENVRAFEARNAPAQGLNHAVVAALVFGALTLGAGVLLFVSAHWESLSPLSRISLVLLMVAVFHVAGAFTAGGFPHLSTTLHLVGTVSLGAGIFMAGQIFNMQEHWPAGIMLWAFGAWIGWELREDWPHAALIALLTPAWLAGEWIVATQEFRSAGPDVLSHGLLLLAIAYFTAQTAEKESQVRRALVIIGGLTLIPLTLFVLLTGTSLFWRGTSELNPALVALGWLVAVALPLGVAYLFRGRAVWMNLPAAAWVLILGKLDPHPKDLLPYVWCAVGSAGLVAWGLGEARRERINLGMAAFALTVLVFYFSAVMDKLERSFSLISLGILFLGGGWALQRIRRFLIARLEGGRL